MRKNMFGFGLLLIGALLLGGCSAGGMKNVEQSGFLGDYSMLQPGSDGSAALTYFKPGVDFEPYTKIMFERVSVTLNHAAMEREVDPAILVEMADYYQNALLEAVKDGYEVVDHKEDADIYVINSCVVTTNAEKKCRAAIRQARRRQKDATIAIVGCFSQMAEDSLSKMQEVDLVMGTEEKFLLKDYLNKAKK